MQLLPMPELLPLLRVLQHRGGVLPDLRVIGRPLGGYPALILPASIGSFPRRTGR